ncbi:transcriptional regulator [Streptomyces sp. NPDC012888]|uniref:transcriptional regulator n=1 Tax=Streptomyces sp. NPDC012888 TaxID=3364855 RepID=UPI0036AC9435
MQTPPFSPSEARAARARMGMTPEQVASGMAQLGLARPPEAVLAWEAGTAVPTEVELFALADALWCPVPTLMALRPTTLREFRLGRQFTAERLARRIGMDPRAYARAESSNQWTGTDRQTLALADALGMRPEEVLDVIGRAAELASLLQQAVEGRWKAHTGQVAELARADERRVGRALRTLHREYGRFNERYMGHLVARSGDDRLREVATERAAWLSALPERFRQLTESGGD